MRSIKVWLGVSLLFLSSALLAADEVRDFYTEPGLNRFKTGMGQDVTEQINNFNGHLQRRYVDLSIPGNGGLDIAINRYYNMPQGMAGYDDAVGLGWTMHHGRITVPSGFASNVCNLTVNDLSNHSPSIEFPDGGREQFFVSAVLNDGTLITKSNWKAECIDPANYAAGLKVTAPNGVVYTMNVYMYVQGEAPQPDVAAPYVESWYPSRIEDLRGNYLAFTYGEITGTSLNAGLKYLTDIDASDGRHVYYEYLDENNGPATATSNSVRIDKIRANGQTWQYQYTKIVEAMTGWGDLSRYQLTSVARPDATDWQYEYYSDPLDLDNYLAMSRAIYPTGGKIAYAYQRYLPYPPNTDFYVRAVLTKQQLTNTDTVHAEWSYSFNPGGYIYPALDGTLDLPVDVVTVNTPDGVDKFYYYGYRTAAGWLNALYEIGLEKQHSVYDQAGNLVQRNTKVWGEKRTISNQVYKTGILSSLYDEAVWQYNLRSESRWTAIDAVAGTGLNTRVDYSDYDSFGNPGTQVMWSTYADVPNINTTTSYINDIGTWTIGLEDTKQLIWQGDASPSSTSVKQYNIYGELISHNQDGVVTLYDYDVQGNLSETTNARLHVTKYLSYYRGLAQTEEYPDLTSITRVVNPSGTVASITDARGFTSSFSYDGLNRLTNIDFPLGHDVSVTWLSDKRTLTRGNYQEETRWDGYGREASFSRTDLGAASTLEKYFSYDLMGRKIFESDFNSSLGVNWTYDRLNRVTRTEFQDGSFTRSVYKGPLQTEQYDENNTMTLVHYRVIGHEGNIKWPYWILTPGGEATIFSQDILGNLSQVFRGKEDIATPGAYLGWITNFERDLRYFLTLEQQDGLNAIQYGRDEVGNMITREVGSSPQTLYQYDEMNRLKLVDYPGTTPDVTLIYDADGNIKSSINSNASRSYDYDNNGNLLKEAISIEGSAYDILYDVNAYDQVNTMTYPSGRVIDFAPDVYGRPTKVGLYVNNVMYNPTGTIDQFTYGNGVISNYQYTPRHWIDQLNTNGTASLVGLNYNYEANGNIQSIGDLLQPTKNRTMTYDGQNRLKTVDGSWGQSIFNYDAQGNFITKSTPGDSGFADSQNYQYTGMQLSGINYPVVNYNRGFTYDDYGNIAYSTTWSGDPLTNPDAWKPLDISYYFDAAGNLTGANRIQRQAASQTIPLKSAQFDFSYDADNNRVTKTDIYAVNEKTHYVYSGSGQFVGEYIDNGPIYGHEYLYLGNQLVTSIKTPAPYVANAGADFSTCAGKLTDLSGSYSDPEMRTSTFAWTQLSGPAVTIDLADQRYASFTPTLATVNEQYTFRFTITDTTGVMIFDDVAVTASFDCPPVANAGGDFYALGGSHFWLDGSASFDYQGPLTFSWSSASFDILDPNSPKTKAFAVDSANNYTGVVDLVVTDNTGNTATDNVVVTVLPRNVDTDNDALPDNWEWIYFGDIALYDGTADPDGDSFTNAQELLAETDPTQVNVPDQIGNLKVISGDTRATLVWEASPVASNYEVYWTTDPSLDLAFWIKANTTANYFDHTALTNGQPYYYAVLPANVNGLGPLSATVSGVPDLQAWTSQIPVLPDGLIADSLKTTVGSNRFGDTLVVTVESEAGIYRLKAWRYSIFTGWSQSETVSESTVAFTQPKAALDIRGNALVTWLENDGTRDNLWSNRFVASSGWGSDRLLDIYNGNSSDVDGSVLEVSDIKFADDGSGVVCWRQNYLRTLNNARYLGGDDFAVARQLSANGTWSGVITLEGPFNIGYTNNLSCDLSKDGQHLIAAWERYSKYDIDQDRVYDIWFRYYSSDSGWQYTGLSLDAALGDTPGDLAGADRFTPSVALDATAGQASLVWWEDDGHVHSMAYDLATQTWGNQEVLSNTPLTGNIIPELAMNDDGGIITRWSTNYVYKETRDLPWHPAGTLPDGQEGVVIEPSGTPISIGAGSNGNMLANRLVDGVWEATVLSQEGDTRSKALLHSNLDGAGNLAVQWVTGLNLVMAEHQSGASTGNSPPVANAGDDQSVLEGALAIVLDGSASTDSDGSIVSYQWEQLLGTPATLFNTTSAIAGFDAPTVTAHENLVFRLSVTDNVGNIGASDVVMQVVDYETTPPITSFSAVKTKSKGKTIYDITLTPDRPSTTWFQADPNRGEVTSGGTNTADWQVYSGPVSITLNKNAIMGFRFNSINSSGTAEAWQVETLQ